MRHLPLDRLGANGLLLLLGLSLVAGPVGAAESKGAATSGLTKPVPAPPPPEPPRAAPAPAAVVVKVPVYELTEIEKLFGVLRLMRRRLTVTEETAFYIGHRHLKLMTFSTPLYDVAVKWAHAYRKAILRLQTFVIAEWLCHPEYFKELKDAIEWGKLRAIGEPWYYKKGYRRAEPLLYPGDVPACVWAEFPPR